MIRVRLIDGKITKNDLKGHSLHQSLIWLLLLCVHEWISLTPHGRLRHERLAATLDGSQVEVKLLSCLEELGVVDHAHDLVGLCNLPLQLFHLVKLLHALCESRRSVLQGVEVFVLEHIVECLIDDQLSM